MSRDVLTGIAIGVAICAAVSLIWQVVDMATKHYYNVERCAQKEAK